MKYLFEMVSFLPFFFFIAAYAVCVLCTTPGEKNRSAHNICSSMNMDGSVTFDQSYADLTLMRQIIPDLGIFLLP